MTVIRYPIDCVFGSVITRGLAITDHGHVAGRYYCSVWTHNEAFIWTPEDGYSTLPRPPGVYSAIAEDINEAGVVCGTMSRSSVGYRGFVYDHGQWTELPPVLPDYGWSGSGSINDRGEVAGMRSIGENIGPQNAFVWSSRAGFTDLGMMGQPSETRATAVNDGGAVVGWRGIPGAFDQEAFLWHDGVTTFLGPVPGGLTSWAWDVNERGVVAGGGRLSVDRAQPAIWWQGQWRLLGLLPDDTGGTAKAVNDAGQVVGLSSNTPTVRGFLWQHGVMYNLNDFVSPDESIYIFRGWDINNAGQILAHGSGDPQTYILTPVGRPIGDLDIDCEVGVSDLLWLLADWAQADSPADLNGDGLVNVLDLAILIDNWT